MSNANPSGCCGKPTSCCPDSTTPDRLTATVTTDCGDYDIPLLISVTLDEVRWSGDGVIECRPPASSNCGEVQVHLFVFCRAGWQISLCGAGHLTFSVNCDPISMTATFDGANCGCGQDIEVTITE